MSESKPAPSDAVQSTSPAKPYYERHIFFCLNERKSGEACCSQQGAQAAFDRCAGGPVAVVYPEGTWYSFVDNADIDEIVDSHLKDGQPVTRLIMPPEVGR